MRHANNQLLSYHSILAQVAIAVVGQRHIIEGSRSYGLVKLDLEGPGTKIVTFITLMD